MNLKSMSIDRLIKMRDNIEVALKSRVAQSRRDLEAKLAGLSRLGSLGTRGISLGKRGGLVAPKYRNPENPQETWAGRGLKPRWLSAALKAGHKIEDFLIGGAPKSATAKTRKAQKRRKVPARTSPKARKIATRQAKAARERTGRRKATAPKAVTQPEAST